jgi:N-carbamoyl-L-amino-acid hydrolase
VAREERLDVIIDPIGNICGVRPGRDPNARPIVMGSHLDTVCDAGAYDGAFGFLAGSK